MKWGTSFLGDHGAIFSHVVPEATKATTVGKVTAINTMPAPVSKSPNGRSSSGGVAARPFTIHRALFPAVVRRKACSLAATS